jgi:uncharacterized protein
MYNTNVMELATLKQKLRPLCVETNVKRLGVFGSVARGDENEKSDVDLIVQFRNPIGMFELMDFEERAEKALGRPVDIGTEAGLHPLIRDNVNKDLKIIYEE